MQERTTKILHLDNQELTAMFGYRVESILSSEVIEDGLVIQIMLEEPKPETKTSEKEESTKEEKVSLAERLFKKSKNKKDTPTK